MTGSSLRRDLARWGISLLAVVGLHGVVLRAAQHWKVTAQDAVAAPAMMLDLPPPTPPAPPAPPPPSPPPPSPPPPPPEPPPPPPPPPQPKPAAPKKVEPRPAQPVAAPADAVPMPQAAPPPAPQPRAPQVPPNWASLLQGKFERLKRYPRAAQLRRDEGTVLLRVVIDRDGTVLEAAVARSSGAASLDEETLLLARRVSPLPAPPAEMKGERITVTVPIKFELR
ncbi:MAG: energy transducer TonB [Acetobacteraceae bacterium]|nr:energy transducer TonB [Acetobacteraceae bacterium]